MINRRAPIRYNAVLLAGEASWRGFRSMVAGDMPPPGTGQPLGEDEIARVARFAESFCPPP